MCNYCKGAGLFLGDYCSCIFGSAKRIEDINEKYTGKYRRGEAKTQNNFPKTEIGTDNSLKIREGDWVICRDKIGYVKQIIEPVREARVKFVRDGDRKCINFVSTCYFGELSLAPIEAYYSLEQLNFLIDLSLETKDKEWFKELSERRGKIGQA